MRRPTRQRLVTIAAATVGSLVLAVLYLLASSGGGREFLYSVTIPEPSPPSASSSSSSSPSAPSSSVAAVPRLPRAIDAEWERRAVAASLVPGRAAIAVVIDDVGLDRGRSLRVIALPAPLTLSFLPYGRDAPALAILARQRGHEIMLHMPMQPVGGENPGPQALSADLGESEIRLRVGAALDRFGDAIGLNNHMGSRFTTEKRLLRPVMDELAARGLVFLDSRTSGASQGARAAEESGVPAALRDVFLDNDLSAEAIARQLEEVERLARRRGFAVAIGHPHDATLAALSVWLPGLSARGLQAVPVSTVIRRSLQRGSLSP
jgi:polysaccharide deacetylase 2 family uncharacterized protein YibQ